MRPGQRVQPRAFADTVTIAALAVDGGGLLSSHPRAATRGSWVVDPAHWDGLPDGRTRATTLEPTGHRDPVEGDVAAANGAGTLAALLHRRAGAGVPVGRRPLADYVAAAGFAGVRR